MAKRFQLPDGTVAKNFKELAEALGVDKVVREDIQEGGQYVDLITILEDDPKPDPVPSNKGGAKKQDEDVDKTQIYSALEGAEEITLSPEEIEASLPEFVELDELKEWIKDIDTPTLEYFARGLKLEWTPTYHKSIHRMRVALAIQAHFFPEQFKPKESTAKKKAKYGDFSTEDLIKMAEEQDIAWEKTGNDPIDRMRVITALKKSGHLPG